MSELNGKHILIVGASEGIGLETAKECARRGARLSLVARSEQIKDIVRELMESQKHAGFCFDMSDIEKIKMTLSAIDHKAFNWAIDTLLEAKRIYVVGIRSCAPLASFMGFYLNLVCDNVITVNTNSSSEIFEQIIRIGEGDVIIGISFPRYSMRTLKALEFASNRKAKVITLTDSIHSPMNQYSSCNLIARSDMASIVDSLVAPLSVINALIVAICMKKQKEVVSTLETLEKIWGEYQVYSGEESSQEGGSAGTNESYRQNKGEE